MVHDLQPKFIRIMSNFTWSLINVSHYVLRDRPVFGVIVSGKTVTGNFDFISFNACIPKSTNPPFWENLTGLTSMIEPELANFGDFIFAILKGNRKQILQKYHTAKGETL